MTMRPPVDAKVPTEEKDYGQDWEKYLKAGVTIATSTWTVPAGITAMTNSIDGAATLIRLSGGTAGADYTLVNAIVTSTGEKLEQALQVRVRTAAQIAGI